MGESTKQLEWNLAAERRDLGRNLQELENKTQALTDWRTYYRQRPMALIGTAFGGALILGLLSRRRAPMPARGEYHDGNADTRRPDAGFRVSPQVAASVDRVKRQAGETWDHIADALVGVAAAKAIDFVSQRIPGFGEEYSKRHAD